MQLADDIAFLGQAEEGAKNVTAVTLQEKAPGLVICLASNHTPSDKTVLELDKTMALVSEYASEGSSLYANVIFRVADLYRKATA